MGNVTSLSSLADVGATGPFAVIVSMIPAAAQSTMSVPDTCFSADTVVVEGAYIMPTSTSAVPAPVPVAVSAGGATSSATPLLQQALARGCVRIVDGLDMLVEQGTAQCEAWTHRPAPLAAMTAAARGAGR